MVIFPESSHYRETTRRFVTTAAPPWGDYASVRRVLGFGFCAWGDDRFCQGRKRHLRKECRSLGHRLEVLRWFGLHSMMFGGPKWNPNNQWRRNQLARTGSPLLIRSIPGASEPWCCSCDSRGGHFAGRDSYFRFVLEISSGFRASGKWYTAAVCYPC